MFRSDKLDRAKRALVIHLHHRFWSILLDGRSLDAGHGLHLHRDADHVTHGQLDLDQRPHNQGGHHRYLPAWHLDDLHGDHDP